MARAMKNALERAQLDGFSRSVRVGRLVATLTGRQFEILKVLFSKNFRAGYGDLIPQFWDCDPRLQDARRRGVATHISLLRNVLHPLGLDIVAIANYGYALESYTPRTTRAPVKIRPADAIDAPPSRIGVKAPLTISDRLRALDMADRHLSISYIATVLRKPYRAVEAAVNGRAA